MLDNNQNEYAYTDTFCATIIKFAKKNKAFRKILYQHDFVDKINKWLSNNGPPLSTYRTSFTVFKNGKHNTKYSYEMINREDSTIKEFCLKRRGELKQMFKKPETEFEDPESESDLYEVDIEIGSKVDFFDYDTYKWVSGTVINSLGEIIIVQKDDDKMEIDGQNRHVPHITIFKDSSILAPHRTKSLSLKASVLSLYQKAYDS